MNSSCDLEKYFWSAWQYFLDLPRSWGGHLIDDLIGIASKTCQRERK
jgi:hypothetical protein